MLFTFLCLSYPTLIHYILWQIAEHFLSLIRSQNTEFLPPALQAILTLATCIAGHLNTKSNEVYVNIR